MLLRPRFHRIPRLILTSRVFPYPLNQLRKSLNAGSFTHTSYPYIQSALGYFEHAGHFLEVHALAQELRDVALLAVEANLGTRGCLWRKGARERLGT